MNSTQDFTQLDDPELFEERHHVREKIDALPRCHPDRLRLAEVYDALTQEFDRRARSAWQPRMQAGETRT